MAEHDPKLTAIFFILQVLGTAVGLNLLLGIPILPAVFFSVFDTLVFQVVLPLMVNWILLNSKLNLCFEKSTMVLSSATSKTEAMWQPLFELVTSRLNGKGFCLWCQGTMYALVTVETVAVPKIGLQSSKNLTIVYTSLIICLVVTNTIISCNSKFGFKFVGSSFRDCKAQSSWLELL